MQVESVCPRCALKLNGFRHSDPMQCIAALKGELESRISDPSNIRPTHINPKKNWRIETEKWISKYPEVYAIFKHLAKELAASGRSKIGIGELAEKVRWHFKVNHKGDSYKISNSTRAYIARRLVQDCPELEPLFEFRKTRC